MEKKGEERVIYVMKREGRKRTFLSPSSPVSPFGEKKERKTCDT